MWFANVAIISRERAGVVSERYRHGSNLTAGSGHTVKTAKGRANVAMMRAGEYAPAHSRAKIRF